ncbi:MAG: S8 family serine peptidase [Rubrivivax sp.]|nr:S8 family serine peptidase [Rubrivivax sp.]
MPRWNPARPLAAEAPGPSLQAPTAQAEAAPIDPYLHWAVATHWRAQQRQARWDGPPEDADLRILLHAPPQRLRALHEAGVVRIAPVYFEPIPGTQQHAHFVTATLPRSGLPRLMAQQGLRWTLAAPRRDQSAPQVGSARGYFGEQADMPPPPAAEGMRWPAAAAVSPGSVVGGAIAVIDAGCPFLHERFARRHAPGTRLAALWVQDSLPATGPWHRPPALGHGRELTGQVMSDLFEQVHGPGAQAGCAAPGEALTYAALQHLVDADDPRRRVHLATHGAHVLDVAGGSTDVVDGRVDAASEAALIFVQLPEATAQDPSGGGLGADVLDALRYVLRAADPASPLVVNLSFGATAGPHDGSTLIEQAIDELLRARPRQFALVIAAGNARQAGAHALRRAHGAARPAAGRSALFRIDVAPGDSTDSFVEFWYARQTPAQPAFRARRPGGDWSGWVGPGHGSRLSDPATGETVAALLHPGAVPNGARALALLALRPTEAPDDDDAPLAEAGLWEVEARVDVGTEGGGGPPLDLDIDAWVERDDPRAFSGRRATRFVGLEPADSHNTLNSLANGRETFVVSGFRCSDGQAVAYASRGPRPPRRPLLMAACERDSIDPGFRAAAVRSGEVLSMNGTSVAAPVATRQIFNLLQAAPQAGLTRDALVLALRREARHAGAWVRLAS